MKEPSLFRFVFLYYFLLISCVFYSNLAIAASVKLKSTKAQAKIIEKSGILEVQIEDYADGTYKKKHFLISSDKRYEITFKGKGKTPSLLTGTKVKVKGSLEKENMLAIATDSTTTNLQVTAPATTNTFGDQRTLIMLVNFQDMPTNKPWTITDVRSLFFVNVNNFYIENSYQQTSISGEVVGWYTLPINSTDICDEARISDESNKAAIAAGINLASYPRRIYAFPKMNYCGYAGLATVGGNPSRAFINGSWVFHTVAHEFGHNLGSDHAHAINCDTTLDGNCSYFEYGDRLDIMGGGDGHFNAFSKERLGWLNYGVSPPITTVSSSGTYSIDAYELVGINPKALKILKSIDSITGIKTWYYLEFRQPVGFDSFISTGFYLNYPEPTKIPSGVIVRMGTDQSIGSSIMLDMTPGSRVEFSSDLDDPALVVGQNYTDSNAGITITPISSSSTSISVKVTLSTACLRAKPLMTLSPTGLSGVAGSTLIYTVNVTNKDDISCGSSSFSLQSTVPLGWSSSFSSSTLIIAPGASASTTLSVTSATSATLGEYPVSATITNSQALTYNVSASSNYAVTSPLSATVSSLKNSYSKGDTVQLTAFVYQGLSPISGAAVNFVITKPNGVTVSGSATTGINGQATFKFRLGRKDLSGTYLVKISTTVNGQSANALTSFWVP